MLAAISLPMEERDRQRERERELKTFCSSHKPETKIDWKVCSATFWVGNGMLGEVVKWHSA